MFWLLRVAFYSSADTWRRNELDSLTFFPRPLLRSSMIYSHICAHVVHLLSRFFCLNTADSYRLTSYTIHFCCVLVRPRDMDFWANNRAGRRWGHRILFVTHSDHEWMFDVSQWRKLSKRYEWKALSPVSMWRGKSEGQVHEWSA